MKKIRLLLVSFFVFFVSTTNVVASEESAKAKIQRAMKAAPSSISAGATIRDVDADWTILRHGEPGNDWTCFPGVPVNMGDKHPMCNDEVWMDWLWAVKALLGGGDWTFTTETIGTSYMLRGDALVSNQSPVATDPYNGDMWDQEGPHIMMLFPTREEIAHLPRDPNAGGPYVMWDAWPLVHVMFPMTDRDR
ncbi:MAG: hypothetical protein V7720_15260 [Halioglobus sp.]